MGDTTLEMYFSGVRLTELFASEAVKRGTPDVLPPEFSARSPNSPVGTQVQWDEVQGNRKLAQLVHQGGASRTTEVQGVTRRFATALGSKEDFVVGQQMLYQLKNTVPLMAEMARRELVNKVANFRTRMDNLAKAVRHAAMATGHIYADGEGNVLPDATGAKFDLDFKIPTANRITKNGSGGTYNIGDWSDATLNIPGKVRGLVDANAKKNGYQLTTILYGLDVPDMVFSNTKVQEYLKRNPRMNQAVLDTNEIPDGLFGVRWRPVSKAYWDDKDGTTRTWWAANGVTVCPDVTPDWYEYFECGTLVPKGVGAPGMSLDQMLEAVAVAYGLFAYAEMGTNPIALKTILGWYGLAVPKVPGTVYMGTVS